MSSSAAHLRLEGGMGLRPVHDLPRAGNRLTLVEDQHRNVDLAGQLLDLLAALAPVAPGPGREPVSRQRPDLVLVAGLIEGLRRASARVAQRGERFLLSAGVE